MSLQNCVDKCVYSVSWCLNRLYDCCFCDYCCYDNFRQSPNPGNDVQKENISTNTKRVQPTNSSILRQSTNSPILRQSTNAPITYQSNATQNPSKSIDSSKRPPSLENIGANCYLNSALQGISSCDKFVTDISTEYSHNTGLKKLELFYKLLCILNGDKGSRLEISRNQIFRDWNKPGQQDSFELLAYVLNQVYGEIRTYKEFSNIIPKRNMEEWLKIELPMRIVIEYKIKCGCGNIVNVPLQSDLALHVSIPSTGENQLQNLVDRFFLEDKIEDYNCDIEGCNGENALRYTKLRKPLPRTICIHLQRTYWNGNRMVKIDKMIHFTKTLKIQGKFCSLKNINIKEANKKQAVIIINATENNPTQVTASMTANETGDDSLDELIVNDETLSNPNVKHCDKNTNNVEDISEEIFTLASVIVHHGSVDGGHYVCYKMINNKWFLTDDSFITEVSEIAVFNSKAYVLFYEKYENFNFVKL